MESKASSPVLDIPQWVPNKRLKSTGCSSSSSSSSYSSSHGCFFDGLDDNLVYDRLLPFLTFAEINTLLTCNKKRGLKLLLLAFNARHTGLVAFHEFIDARQSTQREGSFIKWAISHAADAEFKLLTLTSNRALTDRLPWTWEEADISHAQIIDLSELAISCCELPRIARECKHLKVLSVHVRSPQYPRLSRAMVACQQTLTRLQLKSNGLESRGGVRPSVIQPLISALSGSRIRELSIDGDFLLHCASVLSTDSRFPSVEMLQLTVQPGLLEHVVSWRVAFWDLFPKLRWLHLVIQSDAYIVAKNCFTAMQWHKRVLLQLQGLEISRRVGMQSPSWLTIFGDSHAQDFPALQHLRVDTVRWFVAQVELFAPLQALHTLQIPCSLARGLATTNRSCASRSEDGVAQHLQLSELMQAIHVSKSKCHVHFFDSHHGTHCIQVASNLTIHCHGALPVYMNASSSTQESCAVYRGNFWGSYTCQHVQKRPIMEWKEYILQQQSREWFGIGCDLDISVETAFKLAATVRLVVSKPIFRELLRHGCQYVAWSWSADSGVVSAPDAKNVERFESEWQDLCNALGHAMDVCEVRMLDILAQGCAKIISDSWFKIQRMMVRIGLVTARLVLSIGDTFEKPDPMLWNAALAMLTECNLCLRFKANRVCLCSLTMCERWCRTLFRHSEHIRSMVNSISGLNFFRDAFLWKQVYSQEDLNPEAFMPSVIREKQEAKQLARELDEDTQDVPFMEDDEDYDLNA